MRVVTDENEAEKRAPGWWGSESALLNDEEARRRLVAATVRCILRRGTGRIRIEEVAVEAGVSRSTVYRYFKTRDDLILAVLLSRVDVAMESALRSLPEPDDAYRSIGDVFVNCFGLMNGDAINEALFSEGSRSMVQSVELTAEPIVDAVYQHLAPLLERWQDDGQLRSELDVRETVQWMIAAGVILMAPPWSTWSSQKQRRFVEKYVVQALVNPSHKSTRPDSRPDLG